MVEIRSESESESRGRTKDKGGISSAENCIGFLLPNRIEHLDSVLRLGVGCDKQQQGSVKYSA